ncbi:hypothetical protein A11A3_15911 [Alcanivorax hongdengensis A-11-3]|uniref:Uncharacterized protein n=1 Tax=Alcanivorax hongdengensis A-11-3 TaxID=1177179 RepID=L0W7X7_9GAMM|nr:hypothetical protein A11A3_15911 [Alcanivorax hongdengensis A-11-3]
MLVWLAACMTTTSNTDITGAWRMKGHQPGDHVDQVLVAALVNDSKIRQALEDELVAELQRHGLSAASALATLGPDYARGKDKSQMARELAARGYQSALVVTMLDVRETMRYNPSTVAYVPDVVVSGPMGASYSNRQNSVFEPGYFSRDKQYFLESNLYRLNPQALLWSAQSTTINPADLTAGSQGLADAVVARMAADDMI